MPVSNKTTINQFAMPVKERKINLKQIVDFHTAFYWTISVYTDNLL